MDLAFGCDGRRLVHVSDEEKAVHVLDAATLGEVVALSGHDDVLGSVQLAPDVTTLVTPDSGGLVELWRIG